MNPEKRWYDIGATHKVNNEEQGIFASLLATSERDACLQFFKRFPYAHIDWIVVI